MTTSRFVRPSLRARSESRSSTSLGKRTDLLLGSILAIAAPSSVTG